MYFENHREKDIVTAVIVLIAMMGFGCAIVPWLATVILVVLITGIVVGVTTAIIVYWRLGRIEPPQRVIQEGRRYEIV